MIFIGLFKPSLPRVSLVWVKRLVWMVVFLMAAFVLVTVWENTSPVIQGDNWYYADTLIKHYQDGELSIQDIFTKREGDNSQPVNRLILLGVTRWFQMDLAVQGVLGVFIIICCVLLLSWLAMRESVPVTNVPWISACLPLGFALIMFSLNSTGFFSWPLVITLMSLGTLGGVAYLYFVSGANGSYQWMWIALAASMALVVLDTFGNLMVLASILLLMHRAMLNGVRKRVDALTSAGAAAAVFVAYGYFYHRITGVQSSPLTPENLLAAINYIEAHLDGAWKVLVVPFSIVVFEPLGRHDWLWVLLVPLAALMWLGHVWFWKQYFRHHDKRLAFLASGLMLYFYGTVAGMMVDRIPKYGFDYVFQPRYIAFYELQLVALLLMGVTVFPYSARAVRMGSAIVVLMCMIFVLDIYFGARAWITAPYTHKFDTNMIRQIDQLAADPAVVPQGCLPQITPCRWPLQRRTEVLDVLRSGGFNVFSPDFRRRHGYPPPDYQPPPQR